ncbi:MULTISPECIES: AI-2E family transporter [Enterococcaceae]|uniref:AI-2E family transporter n=1 Tax=Enterococcaceae TaxID=81852 RepID=UPI000E4DB4AD|nr:MULTISPECIES: AI-2E family transporter [Enterococcaceae]MCI0130334.1 AI-2E family transporter [Vagococcus sp. CY53-2]RGI32067.1 AI-2E family transporter [Melissococcus sp. OM08-11BH]
MVDLWRRMKASDSVRRTLVLLIICSGLYLIRNILSLILLTFILTYLIIRGVDGIHHVTKLPKKLVAIAMYLLMIIFLYFSITVYVPKLFNQTIQMIEEVFNFYQKADTNNKLYEWIAQNVGFNEIKQQLTTGAKVVFTTITNIGSMGITFVMSLILSFFFIIEKDWVTEFGQAFFKSKIGLFSQDVAYLGKKFVNTFGVVIEAQFIIAIVNTILTIIGLIFMKFPQDQLLSLALMIFILSLIPVAGVIISCIPLSLIAYTVGGVQDVIYILIMIMIIHAVESYLLNPKLMSSKTDLPIFYVFVILMFSEKFFGVWGLVIGVPAFVFLLDLLDVKVEHKKPPVLPQINSSK